MSVESLANGGYISLGCNCTENFVELEVGPRQTRHMRGMNLQQAQLSWSDRWVGWQWKSLFIPRKVRISHKFVQMIMLARDSCFLLESDYAPITLPRYPWIVLLGHRARLPTPAVKVCATVSCTFQFLQPASELFSLDSTHAVSANRSSVTAHISVLHVSLQLIILSNLWTSQVSATHSQRPILQYFRASFELWGWTYIYGGFCGMAITVLPLDDALHKYI